MSQRSNSESSNGGLEEHRVPASTENNQLSLDEGLPALMEETEEETVEGALLEQQALLEIIQAGPPMPQEHDDGSPDEGIAAEGQPIVIEPFEELVASGILPPPPPIVFADMPMSPAAAIEFIEEGEEGLLGHIIIYDPQGLPHYGVQQPAQYEAGFDEDQNEHQAAGFEDQEEDAGFEDQTEEQEDEDM